MIWRNLRWNISISFLVLFFISCGGKKEIDSPKPFNPNGDSELAILMRKMVKTLEENRVLLAENKEIVPFSFEMKELLTAEPTKGAINDRSAYESFTNNFIDSVNAFYTSDANKFRHFNGVIQSCISCHQTFCMGPIPVMERLQFSAIELDSLTPISK